MKALIQQFAEKIIKNELYMTGEYVIFAGSAIIKNRTDTSFLLTINYKLPTGEIIVIKNGATLNSNEIWLLHKGRDEIYRCDIADYIFTPVSEKRYLEEVTVRKSCCMDLR